MNGLDVQAPIAGAGLLMATWCRRGARDRESIAATSAQMWALVDEFPALPWALFGRPPTDALVIEERAWGAPTADPSMWDRAFSAPLAPRWLVVQGEGDSRTLGDAAREILTRYQRLAPRRNADSSTPLFAAVLARHRSLHDLSLPLVRADYDHALDVWQWMLRLRPNVGLAPQLAALFHDIERLLSEAERRIEHTAADYQAFKNAHADAGARLTAKVLDECGLDRATIAAVARLIREHELPLEARLPLETRRDSDAALLADADALSFFSLNSPGFADYYGPLHTGRKVRYTLGRMSAAAVRRLASIRLRADVARALADVAQAEARATLMAVGA